MVGKTTIIDHNHGCILVDYGSMIIVVYGRFMAAYRVNFSRFVEDISMHYAQ